MERRANRAWSTFEASGFVSNQHVEGHPSPCKRMVEGAYRGKKYGSIPLRGYGIHRSQINLLHCPISFVVYCPFDDWVATPASSLSAPFLLSLLTRQGHKLEAPRQGCLLYLNSLSRGVHVVGAFRLPVLAHSGVNSPSFSSPASPALPSRELPPFRSVRLTGFPSACNLVLRPRFDAHLPFRYFALGATHSSYGVGVSVVRRWLCSLRSVRCLLGRDLRHRAQPCSGLSSVRSS